MLISLLPDLARRRCASPRRAANGADYCTGLRPRPAPPAMLGGSDAALQHLVRDERDGTKSGCNEAKLWQALRHENAARALPSGIVSARPLSDRARQPRNV